jgi:hypothetical protein
MLADRIATVENRLTELSDRLASIENSSARGNDLDDDDRTLLDHTRRFLAKWGELPVIVPPEK